MAIKSRTNTWGKGMSFESYAKRYIENVLRGALIFNNIRTYSPRINKNTEIDCIVFYKDTMFILEMKSPRNMLFGYSYHTTWLCYSGKYKTRIYNPVLQNYTHSRAIKNIIKDKHKINIEPLVCVPIGCKIDSDLDYLVYTLDTIILKMLELSNEDNLLGVEEIKDIMNMIRRSVRYE